MFEEQCQAHSGQVWRAKADALKEGGSSAVDAGACRLMLSKPRRRLVWRNNRKDG